MTSPAQERQLTMSDLNRVAQTASTSIQDLIELLKVAAAQGLDLRPEPPPPAPEPPRKTVAETAPAPVPEPVPEPAAVAVSRYAPVALALEDVIVALSNALSSGLSAPLPETTGANAALDEFQAKVESLRGRLRVVWYLHETAYWELIVQSPEAARLLASYRRRIREKSESVEKIRADLRHLRETPAAAPTPDQEPELPELPRLCPADVIDRSAALPTLRLTRWAEAVDSAVNRRIAAMAPHDHGRIEEVLRPVRESVERQLPEDLGMLWHALIQVRPSGTLQEAIDRLEEAIRPFGFERIQPEAGEKFEQRLHSALRSSGVIKSVTMPGYKLGRDVKKRATVETT